MGSVMQREKLTVPSASEKQDFRKVFIVEIERFLGDV
jgi:hypothetical protein